MAATITKKSGMVSQRGRGEALNGGVKSSSSNESNSSEGSGMTVCSLHHGGSETIRGAGEMKSAAWRKHGMLAKTQHRKHIAWHQ